MAKAKRKGVPQKGTPKQPNSNPISLAASILGLVTSLISFITKLIDILNK